MYSLDYVRGIDIIKFDRSKPARDTGLGRWNPRRPGMSFASRADARDAQPFVCPVPVALSTRKD